MSVDQPNGLPDCPVCRQPVDGITYGGLPHTPRLALLPEVTGAIEPLSFELLPCQCRILGYLTAENRIKRWEVLR